MKQLFFVLALVSILTACGRDDIKNTTSTHSPSTTKAEETQISVPSGGIGESIAEDSSFQLCAREAVRGCGSQTITTYANNGSSVTVCDGFTDPILRTTCIRAITQAQAAQSGKTTTCDTLTDTLEQYSCKRQVVFISAERAGEPKKCNELRDITRPETSALSFPPGNMIDQCMLSTILMIKDLKKATIACDLMSESGIISLCKSQIVEREKVMIQTSNPTTPSPEIVPKTPTPIVTLPRNAQKVTP